MANAPAGDVQIRHAGAADAPAVAALHADSWRHHYRGAYSDEFLDGDVDADRLDVWSARLEEEDPLRRTLVADDDDGTVAFINVYLDHEPAWGALLDNLHVTSARKRGGIGARLVTAAASEVCAHRPGGAMYVWVLEQNVDGHAFYEAMGPVPAGREPVTPPGGVAGRPAGSPMKLRYAWPAPALAALAADAAPPGRRS